MDYIVKSIVSVEAEVAPGIRVYWIPGESRAVSKECILFYQENSSAFTIISAPIVSNDSLCVGGDTNHLETSSDGSLRLRGTATAWRDMIGDIFGSKLNSSAGKVDYDWDENAIVFAPSGDITKTADRVQWNQEIDHDFKIGTDISFYPHIHWWQDSATAFVLTIQYRIQRNGFAKTDSWTTTTITTGGVDDLYTYVSGTINQLTKTHIPITLTCGVSDTLQVRVARTDSETGSLNMCFIDLHGEIDSFGSEEEYIKQP